MGLIILEVPSSVDSRYHATFPYFANGNAGIAKAFEKIINLNLKTLLAQQNNPYGQYFDNLRGLFCFLFFQFFVLQTATYFLSAMFNFYQQNLKVFQFIVKEITHIEKPSTSETVTINIAPAVSDIISKGAVFAQHFIELSEIYVEFETAIASPTAVSSNELMSASMA